jgi:hypothetical protein
MQETIILKVMFFISLILLKILINKIILSDYIFLIPIFIIGLITSFEDYKYGKIKNKWIKIGLLWGVIALGLTILWNFFSVSSVINFSYLSQILINTIIAFIIGSIMWYWAIWSAGDAKLFTLFSFLLPLKFYSNTYLFYFPSFALLLNIFIVALTIFLIMLIWNFVFYVFKRDKKILTKEEKDIKRKKMKTTIFSFIKEVLNLLVVFFVMINLIGIIFRSSLKEELTYFFNTILGLENWVLFIAVLGFFIFLIRFLKKLKKLFYAIAIFLLIWLFYAWFKFGQSPLLTIKPMLGTTAMLVFGGLIFRKTFDWHVNKKEIQEIDIKNIKTGTRLTEESLRMLENKSKTKKFFKQSIGKVHSDGLLEEQVLFLKKFAESKKIEKLKIYKLSPFAIWIFIGLIVTIILKGSILQLILS